MSDFDSPWKEALDCYLQDFLALVFPQAHGEIDWSRGYEALDKELQQAVRGAELGRRVVDKLVKVWLRDGREEWVLIHIEIQSTEEADFAQRMYVYHYRLFDRYNRQVVSLAVLADERATWRPNHFGYELWGCRLAFDFPVVKLLDFAGNPAALEANPNPFATLVLAHLKTQETRQDPDERRSWKVRLIKGMYDRGLGAMDVRRLFRFIDWMMDLPKGLEKLVLQEVQQFEEEKHMPFITSAERLGREEGLREMCLEGIELMLRGKFGDEGAQLLPEIRQIEDLELLRTIHRAIMPAASLEEVRRLWP